MSFDYTIGTIVPSAYSVVEPISNVTDLGSGRFTLVFENAAIADRVLSVRYNFATQFSIYPTSQIKSFVLIESIAVSGNEYTITIDISAANSAGTVGAFTVLTDVQTVEANLESEIANHVTQNYWILNGQTMDYYDVVNIENLPIDENNTMADVVIGVLGAEYYYIVDDTGTISTSKTEITNMTTTIPNSSNKTVFGKSWYLASNVDMTAVRFNNYPHCKYDNTSFYITEPLTLDENGVYDSVNDQQVKLPAVLSGSYYLLYKDIVYKLAVTGYRTSVKCIVSVSIVTNP